MGLDPYLADERAMLENMVDRQRDAVAGIPRGDLGLPDTIDESFVLTDEDTVESVREAFLAACERSREIAATHELDEQFPWHQGPVTLRYIYGHMIAELARHAGHGDILVEQLKAGAPK